jgi:hypothetical protein
MGKTVKRERELKLARNQEKEDEAAEKKRQQA